jgi:hypothetical protein
MRKGRYVIGFDTEDDTRGNPFLFAFVDDTGSFYCETRNEALSFLERKADRCSEKNIILEAWATNLEYDIVNLFGSERIREVQLIFGKSYLVGAEWTGHNVQFRDTVRHIPAGVAALGKLVGLKKLERPEHEEKGKEK